MRLAGACANPKKDYGRDYGNWRSGGMPPKAPVDHRAAGLGADRPATCIGAARDQPFSAVMISLSSSAMLSGTT